ncbi:MAG: N-acetyl-gamma-glutamyl-phosphate reductase [Alphaproteobacteria bacterium]|nr:N-acetyl-gamma-glutamyl-phosphate reductase [Alphaproteobacteria bacterium]
MIKASIIGITGYTGLEQLRMLLAHPEVEIAYLTSRQHENTPIGEIYPHLAHLDLKITDTDHKEVAKKSDVVFLALPHKTAQSVVADLHGKVKVIDHSADYRLDDLPTYEKFYGLHTHPELFKSVVYGITELNREKIRTASTVANPGCFSLLTQLMLLPFAGTIAHVDVMAVTGSSGAGKTPGESTHHPVRNHNIKSYNINTHRHIPEIIRTAQITPEQISFVPCSGPFTRGIFATAFVQTHTDKDPKCAVETYKTHPFIRIQEDVSLANIVGSNYCDLSYKKISDKRYILQGAFDNLTKGAAGNATQVMNLMFGLEETTGLKNLAPLYP